MRMMKMTMMAMMQGLALLLLGQMGKGDPTEAQALKSFMLAVDQRHVLVSNWTGDDPCAYNWVGIFCQKGFVYNLVLESIGLSGTIPNNTLSGLANLRRISLKNNSLSGPLPDLYNSARSLLAIWLHQNQFSGQIPDTLFAKTRRLRKLFLSNNQLSGSIPPSLAFLANISDLHLEYNQLSEGLPSFDQESLKGFNVSYNQLTGPIPATAVMQQKFNQTSYLGNPGLCGAPLSLECNGAAVAPAEPSEPDVSPGPLPASSPDMSEGDFGAPAPWEEGPSGAMRVMEHGHGRRNAILAVLVGVFLLF